MTKKGIEVNDLSNVQYSVNNRIRVRFKTSMLRSVVRNYNDKCIVLKA